MDPQSLKILTLAKIAVTFPTPVRYLLRPLSSLLRPHFNYACDVDYNCTPVSPIRLSA